LENLRSPGSGQIAEFSIAPPHIAEFRPVSIGTVPATSRAVIGDRTQWKEQVVATFDERVSFLEGRVAEHSKMVNGLREAIASLELRMDHRFASLEEKMDRRFVAVDQKLGALDQKLTRHFLWLAGIVVTGVAAMIVKVLH